MRRSFPVAIVVACLTVATGLLAQSVTPDDRAFFDKHIGEFVKLECTPTPVDSPAVKQAFAARLYKVQVVLKVTNGTSTENLVMARVGDTLINIERPGEDQDLPEFPKMVNPAFALTTDAAARTFQQALDEIYPIVGNSDKKVEAFRHAGNQWIFIRGMFIDTKLGFILTTNAAGSVVAAKFSLKIP